MARTIKIRRPCCRALTHTRSGQLDERVSINARPAKVVIHVFCLLSFFFLLFPTKNLFFFFFSLNSFSMFAQHSIFILVRFQHTHTHTVKEIIQRNKTLQRDGRQIKPKKHTHTLSLPLFLAAHTHTHTLVPVPYTHAHFRCRIDRRRPRRTMVVVVVFVVGCSFRPPALHYLLHMLNKKKTLFKLNNNSFNFNNN